ncbi:MAG TPA: ISNCY family transposase [Terracidiphilus sp.]|nr:ISNCY family transposase [Terracidiphilus sp.]
MMKVQEVILRAMAGRLKWWDAAEILGVTDRTMRRWRQRYEEHGYDGLYDRRKGRPSPKKIAVKTLQEVLELYRDKYFDFNVRHFHEKLVEEHGIDLSYSWVKLALQGAGLVKKQRRRGTHRRRRERRPMPGMLLHIDASKHAWLGGERYYDLITIMDDATSEVYYAQLVDEEGTRTLMPAVREVIEKQGIFCALYSDRASHFFVTPKAGGKVDENQVTQLGRALRELGIKMIPAYSPQARGRMERSYRTWQGRLPQELRTRKIGTVEQANRFLRERYIAELNRRFQVKPKERGSAFVPTRRKDLEWVFSIQHERTVNQDNTIALDNRILQIEKTRWRNTLAGCRVTVYEHLAGAVLVRYGPHEVARFEPGALPAKQAKTRSSPRPLGHQRTVAA